MSPLLSRPGFRRLWASGAVSETGDWLLLIALPVYVLQLTGSTLTTSTVFLVELAGALLAGPLAGVLADRWDRRRLLIGASLAQAALLLPLLAVDGADRLWIVYLVTAAQAVLSTANGPVRQALLPVAVEPDELAPAAAQLDIAANLARLVGGALGGVLLQAYGLSGVVLADAATFVLAGAAADRLAGARGSRGPRHRPGSGGSGWPAWPSSGATGAWSAGWWWAACCPSRRACSWCCSWSSSCAGSAGRPVRSGSCAGCRRSAASPVAW